MKFELLTLSGSKYSGEAAQVSLVTTNGALGILPHHEALTAIAVPGPVTVREPDGQEAVFATFGGMLEVTVEGANGGTVRLMADEAEASEELVAAEVAEALERAKRMRAEAKDHHELARAQELVDRQTVRLGVAKMRRHAPRHETRSE